MDIRYEQKLLHYGKRDDAEPVRKSKIIRVSARTTAKLDDKLERASRFRDLCDAKSMSLASGFIVC